MNKREKAYRAFGDAHFQRHRIDNQEVVLIPTARLADFCRIPLHLFTRYLQRALHITEDVEGLFLRWQDLEILLPHIPAYHHARMKLGAIMQSAYEQEWRGPYAHRFLSLEELLVISHQEQIASKRNAANVIGQIEQAMPGFTQVFSSFGAHLAHLPDQILEEARADQQAFDALFSLAMPEKAALPCPISAHI